MNSNGVLKTTGWDNDVLQVKVPLPFPLRWVNAYLVRGKDGYTVIDPGLHTTDAEQLWERTLDGEKIGWNDIGQIVLTHHHPDHYGMTGWFQERTGAPVFMTRSGHSQARMLWQDGEPMTEAIAALFHRHGMTGEAAADLVPHLNSFVRHVSPQPSVSYIEAGTEFRLGDRVCETIHTPGHAEGHLCFYDRALRHMFCGDHILPQISPNVSYIPGVDENPLRSFLESLGEMRGYDVEKAYPGHREPFAAFAQRAEELIEHHRERLAMMRERLRRPMTAYELCVDVFGTRLTMHQMRFALSETLAHVFYMERQGGIRLEERDGVAFYQAV